MKLSEIPQDKSSLENFTREVCYAKDSDGKYQSELSTGWNIKSEALNAAWDDINEQAEEAKQLVLNGTKSPIYFFMVKKLMDVSLLSSYTGFWKFTVRRHLKPNVFAQLSDKDLSVYSEIFEVDIEELKNFKGDK